MSSSTQADLTKSLEAWPPGDEADADQVDVQPDPSIGEYLPQPHQQRFHDLREPFKAAIGGLGMGKSVMSCAEAFFHACVYNRATPHVGIVAAPTYPMIRDVILPVYRSMWPGEVMRGGSWATGYSKSEKVLYLANGSAVFFRSLDRGNYERARGIERVGWVGVDEAALLPNEKAWQVLTGRMRYKPVRVRSAWATTTPRGPNWVADRWILDPLPGYACVRGRTMDNRALASEYVEQQRRELSEKQFRQEILGEIVTLAGAVYDVSTELWPAGNAVYIDVDRGHDTYLAVDFGRLNPRAILLQYMELRHPETGEPIWCEVVVDEWKGDGGHPPYDCLIDDMIAWARGCGYRIVRIYGDPAGDARNEHTHKSSAQKLSDALGVKFLAPRGAQRIKSAGEELMASWVKAADGTRRLLFATDGTKSRLGGYVAKASNAMRACQLLQYPEPRPGQPTPNESMKDGENDHDTDALRYYLVKRHDGKGNRMRGAPLRVVG